MNRVFVLNQDKTSLSPCRAARARKLLSNGKAAVWRVRPFTIILKELKKNPEFQDTQIKIAPGSKTSGIAIVLKGKIKGWFLVWAANLKHKGTIIKLRLKKRRDNRRSRRSRKTRYRKARFLNRTKEKGWLPPSILSRVNNIIIWIKKLKTYCYLKSCVLTVAKFDTQKMQNPEISGIQYQHGELQGFEVREYLLEKYNRTCVYCNKTNLPVEIDHVIPKSKGGSNRISNLVLSCIKCNIKKGNKTIESFLKNKPYLLEKIKKGRKTPLVDAAVVNSARKKIPEEVKKLLITEISMGYITKFNRVKQRYEKDHWIDAACIGKDSGRNVLISEDFKPLLISAIGRGNRRSCLVDKFGFPRTKPKSRIKIVNGVQSGDIVIVKHKKGSFIGKVALTNNSFIMKRGNSYIGFKAEVCKVLQKIDGYVYNY